MKKIIKIFLFISLFLGINQTFAIEIKYDFYPKIDIFENIDNVSDFDYIKDFPVYFGNNGPIQYCYQLGGSYISHETSSYGDYTIYAGLDYATSGKVAYFGGSRFQANSGGTTKSITCEIPEYTTVEETLIVDKKDGINKSIFTKDELYTIYSFELALLLVLLSYIYIFKFGDSPNYKRKDFIFFKFK